MGTPERNPRLTVDQHWEQIGIWAGPEQVIPEYASDALRKRLSRLAAVRVTATTIYDRTLRSERLKFSYCFGWYDPVDDFFITTGFVPDERATEFLEAFREAIDEVRDAMSATLRERDLAKADMAKSVRAKVRNGYV